MRSGWSGRTSTQSIPSRMRAGANIESPLMWFEAMMPAGSQEFEARPSQRLQRLDQILLLLSREVQLPDAIVVRDDIGECRRTAVVEIRHMLHEPAQRRGPIRLVRGPLRVA